MEKKTPLYAAHQALGGKIVPFAGYLLPVQYEGILSEHTAVRTHAGLFDVSHMGEIVLSGEDALQTVQHLLCNDYAVMRCGAVRYSPMLRENGGILDDLLVYKQSETSYLLVVNASNHEKDAAWIAGHLVGDTRFDDQSDRTAQIALQGPLAEAILKKLTSAPLPEKYYTFLEHVPLCGAPCLVSRTGYTGEDGFELYCPNEAVVSIWNALLELGREDGLVPCGLGARDTLRAEAAMPLYGHEMTEEINPFEAGLGMFVKLGKEEFIGRDALLSQTEPKRKRCGLKVTGRGIPREQCAVYAGDALLGAVTTGTHSATLGYPIAMALLNTDAIQPGREVEIDVRGRKITAEIVPTPFYKRAK